VDFFQFFLYRTSFVDRIVAYRKAFGVHTTKRLDVDKTVALRKPDWCCAYGTTLRRRQDRRIARTEWRAYDTTQWRLQNSRVWESLWRAYDSTPRRWQDRHVAGNRWCAVCTNSRVLRFVHTALLSDVKKTSSSANRMGCKRHYEMTSIEQSSIGNQITCIRHYALTSKRQSRRGTGWRAYNTTQWRR